MKKIFGCMITATFIILLSILLFAPGKKAQAEDTTAPVVVPDSIKVSKTTIDLDGTVTISVKIDDESELGNVIMTIIGAGLNNDYAFGAYNSVTGLWDFELTTSYFGLNEIQYIMVSDAYGNSKTYYNSASARVPDYYTAPTDEYADLSKGNFTVSSGTYSEEHNPPVADLSSLIVSNPNPKYNDTVYYKVKMTDASPITYTYITYYAEAYGDTLNSHGKYNASSGFFEYELNCFGYGKIEPLILVAEDAYGNVIRYTDRKQSSFKEDYLFGTEIDGTLSGANVLVSGAAGDAIPPTLETSSFKAEKLYLERNETTTISFKASDNIEINANYSDVWYGGEGGNSVASSCVYNEKTGLFEVQNVSSLYFGTHQIYMIRLRDSSGNTRLYYDGNSIEFKNLGYIPQPGDINCDLSSSVFYVGLKNHATGTFVSNSTMDDTTRLNVDELDASGAIYDKLLPAGNVSKGFFEVDVDGKCDMSSEKTKVCFDAPEGFTDGDVMTIQHLLSDGTIQTQVSYVTNGMVRIDVNEFSPFLVSVAKSADKNQFTKKGLKYQVISNTSVRLTGTTKKSIKSVSIPEKVTAFGKTYNVTEIGEKAFYKCKKLKKITIKSTKLKSIGKYAIKGIYKKAVIKVPKKKLSKYKKLFTTKTGFKKKTMKIKK